MQSLSASCPESSNWQVTSFIFSSGSFFVGILVGFSVWLSLHVLIGTTVDEELVAYYWGSEGSAGQINKFVSDLIVSKNHETSILASKRILKGEMGITTISFVRKLWGISAYLIDNPSWNSCAESTIQFTVDRRTESHAPVSFPLRIIRLCSAIIRRRMVASLSLHNTWFLFFSSAFPLCIVAEWSFDLKYAVPRRAAIWHPQINVENFQFCSAVVDGLGPACFTARQASCRLMSQLSPSPKSDGKQFLARTCPAALNSSLSLLVISCRNCHSCWRDFCNPAYAVCRYLLTTLESSSTMSAHVWAFSWWTHLRCSALLPMNSCQAATSCHDF